MQKYNIGDKFGRWELLERRVVQRKVNESHREFKNISKWICRCDCGTIKEVFQGSLTSRNGGGKSTSCGCYCKEVHVEKMWKGYEEISGRYLSTIRENAERRNIQFLLTPQYIWDLFLNQNRRCALSGTELSFPQRGRIKKDETKQTASLDRIDSLRPYIEGNVQWVHKDINQMKMNMGEEKFLQYIEMIYKFRVGD